MEKRITTTADDRVSRELMSDEPGLLLCSVIFFTTDLRLVETGVSTSFCESDIAAKLATTKEDIANEVRDLFKGAKRITVFLEGSRTGYRVTVQWFVTDSRQPVAELKILVHFNDVIEISWR